MAVPKQGIHKSILLRWVKNLNSWLGEAYKIDKFNKFIWWLYLPCSILMQAAV